MMHTDPYLKALIASKPQYEKEIYELFIEKDLNGPINDFSNTPTWALTRLYNKDRSTKEGTYKDYSPLRHENFDLNLIDQLINENEADYFTGIVHNPNIGAERLKAISQGDDDSAAAWAEFYLYKDTPEIENFLLTELKKNNVEEIRFITTHILRDCKLSESCVDTLMKKYLDKNIVWYRKEETVGSILSQNRNLTDEQRAAMQLLGYQILEPEVPLPPYLPSSQLFPDACHKHRLNPNRLLLEAIATTGHPFTAIDEDYKEVKVEISELNLYQLINAEYLHRALWTELIGVDGFQLNYRNGYRVTDLFISHATLGKEFENTDYDAGYLVGGVLAGDQERTWIKTVQSIDPERAADLLVYFGASWDEIMYDFETLRELYAPALAHFASGETREEYANKYGVKLSDSAEDVITEGASEIADQEEFDVEAELNPDFREHLSWMKLSHSKKEVIVALLKCGMESKNVALKGDAEHLLGCIALHPDTPRDILATLQSLGNELIAATLARRSS